MNPFEIITNTIIAKTSAVVITYPYQVIRTRLQHIDGESHHIIKIIISFYKKIKYSHFIKEYI